jgi:hypothetical protein
MILDQALATGPSLPAAYAPGERCYGRTKAAVVSQQSPSSKSLLDFKEISENGSSDLQSSRG